MPVLHRKQLASSVAGFWYQYNSPDSNPRIALLTPLIQQDLSFVASFNS